MSANFIIAETESFQKLIQKPHFRPLYSKIVDYIYPQLRQNPFFGLNIKKLKGDLNNFYRYRIGNHRLFYSIDKTLDKPNFISSIIVAEILPSFFINLSDKLLWMISLAVSGFITYLITIAAKSSPENSTIFLSTSFLGGK